jgi:hypothetical protein
MKKCKECKLMKKAIQNNKTKRQIAELENNLIALEYLYLKSKNDPKYIDLVFVRTKQYWTSKKNLKEMKKLQKYYGNYVVIDGWYKEITNIIRQNIVRLKNY